MDMLDIMFLFLFLAVVPSLIIMMTSFTRIVIVLSFLRKDVYKRQDKLCLIQCGQLHEYKRDTAAGNSLFGKIIRQRDW